MLLSSSAACRRSRRAIEQINEEPPEQRDPFDVRIEHEVERELDLRRGK